MPTARSLADCVVTIGPATALFFSTPLKYPDLFSSLILSPYDHNDTAPCTSTTELIGRGRRALPPGPPRIEETTMQPKLCPIRCTDALGHACCSAPTNWCMPDSPTLRARFFMSQNDTCRSPESTPF